MEYLDKYIYWQKVLKIGLPWYQILNLQYFKYQIPTTLTRQVHVCSTVKDLHVDAVRDWKCLMHNISELIYTYVVSVFFHVLLLYCIYNVA